MSDHPKYVTHEEARIMIDAALKKAIKYLPPVEPFPDIDNQRVDEIPDIVEAPPIEAEPEKHKIDGFYYDKYRITEHEGYFWPEIKGRWWFNPIKGKRYFKDMKFVEHYPNGQSLGYSKLGCYSEEDAQKVLNAYDDYNTPKEHKFKKC